MIDRPTGARFRSALIFALVALALGCGESRRTGPDEVHWDRQTCEHCQMVISDRHHAVQVRAQGERHAHAFDDLGCAVLWLEGEDTEAGDASAADAVEIWVRDPDGQSWVDASRARFESGLPTPMGYGFGTAEAGLSFIDVRQRVLDAAARRRSGRSTPRTPSTVSEGARDE